MSDSPHKVWFFPDKWEAGCLGLSVIEEGLYIRICNYIMRTGKRLPIDRPHALIRMHHQQFKTLVLALIKKGKIEKYDDGYGNKKAEQEYQNAHTALAKETPKTNPSARDGGAAGNALEGQEWQGAFDTVNDEYRN